MSDKMIEILSNIITSVIFATIAYHLTEENTSLGIAFVVYLLTLRRKP